MVAEISCWMWTGERQSTKMRIKYLEAALNQDIQFFDTEVRTSDVVFAINSDTVMVQDAISEKVNQKEEFLLLCFQIRLWTKPDFFFFLFVCAVW